MASIAATTQTLVYVAPGITKPVVGALAERLDSQSDLQCTLILDLDPEVYRLGYGTEEGLIALQALATRHHLELRQQEGIRIGLLITDGQTVLYSPTPLLIEAGSVSVNKPNAVVISAKGDSTAALMNTPMWSYNGSNGNNYYGLFRRWGLGTHLTTNAAMGDIVVAGKTMAGHPGEAYGLISDAYVDLGNSFGIIFITNGKKGAYAFGSTSAFYDVEEDVFAAAYGLIVSAPTAVPASEGNIPTGTVIRPNHPNPFNPTTNIQFTVDRTDRAVLTVYTMLGQQIATLFDGTAEAGKIYSTRWTGAGLASGPYIAQLEHSGSVIRNRMLLIK